MKSRRISFKIPKSDVFGKKKIRAEKKKQNQFDVQNDGYL